MVVAWYWQPGSRTLVRMMMPDSPWYWRELVYNYYSDAILILFLLSVGLASRLGGRYIYVLGRAPVRQDIHLIAITVVLTFCASSAIDTITLVPLSYLFPNFVAWWLRWAFGPVIYLSMDGSLPIGANLLNFVSLVVLGPAVQEFIFRGYLLHRWSRKWGLWNGVVLSSAVFGAIHPDTLSAMVTGLGFALLYLKTQSLWAPIVAHGIYNLIVWLWNLYDVMRNHFKYVTYTIAQLREDWWSGAVAVIVVLFLIDVILKRKEALGPFRLPTPEGRNA